MITLMDILHDLEEGELNQFSLSGVIDGPMGILPKDYPMLIRMINLGLTDLHTRLELKEREVTINLFDAQYRYHLDSRYSIHNVTAVEFQPKYILDPPDNAYRFMDDIIQIRAAYDECGNELPLNDTEADNSVFIVNHNTIQHCGDAGDSIVIVYQANHPKLKPDAELTTEISIPDNLREALYAFVVHRVLSRSQSPEQVSVAQAFKMKYDTIIDNIKRLNTLNTQDNTAPIKFVKKGWI